MNKIIVTSGLALFAMFFGAGNIIFPLSLGAKAGEHYLYVLPAFLIAAIGLPFLGLWTTSLYQGNYYHLFSRLGKVPSFILITFLVLIIGPLFGAPRTECVSYHTLSPFLPTPLQNPFVFSGLYCILIFAFAYKHTRLIDIIGKILSPVKLFLFSVLILVGLFKSYTPMEINMSHIEAIKLGLVNGYSTMDLLAAFFFSAAIYQHILAKTKSIGITDHNVIMRILLSAFIVGGLLLAFVYSGFMLISARHASLLQHIDTAETIMVISNLILGKLGSYFVCFCVGFACLVTAIAVTEISTAYFYEYIFKRRFLRTSCLIGILISVYCMSIIGFSGIMKIALPIIEFLYPALIFYCIYNAVITLVFKQKQPQESTT